MPKRKTPADDDESVDAAFSDDGDEESFADDGGDAADDGGDSSSDDESDEEERNAVLAEMAAQQRIAAADEEGDEEEEDDDDWWRLTHGCGVGSPPLAVLLTTADRMADFRTGGYEDNLVKGSSWSVGALLAPLQDHRLAAVTSAGAEAGEAWEERCSALEASGDLNAEFSGNGGPAREEALRALRALHKVLSDVGVSPLDLQRAAALT
mmetsp:Transcript_25465/g.76740  ORF Transcript_25465/g.76740 Transcript_25465/m.76740 type:complete len:209 (-) Transcript_25465:61-687(-)